MKTRTAHDLAILATDTALGREHDHDDRALTLLLLGKSEHDLALLVDSANQRMRMATLESQLTMLVATVAQLSLVVRQLAEKH